MFQHLELLPWKGLRSATLQNLGQVTVVCGKNSSGKSTILECIADKQKRSPGRVLNETEIDGIASRSVHAGGWGGRTELNERFKNYLRRHLKGKPMFYSQVPDVCERMLNERGDLFGHYSFPTGHIHTALQAVLVDHDETVLVPAKRACEVKKAVLANDAVLPDGRGIINSLFAAKNLQEDADAHQRFKLLQTGFEAVSVGHQFDIFLTDSNEVELKFAAQKGPWVSADSCGLGLQEVLLLLFFGLFSEYTIVLLEEPENHLHPDFQRRLMLYLREHSRKQFFMTTHSNVFLNPGTADKVFLTRFTDQVVVENVTNRALALHELGYAVADNLVSDLVILVEGPTDRPVLEEFLAKEELLQNYSIKIWPMGGDIMSQLDLSVFTDSYKVIALIDSDPGSGKERSRFVENCKLANIPVHKLARRAIENYFSIEALRAVFDRQIPSGFTEIEPQTKLSEQLGFEVKRNNAALARVTSREHLIASDLPQFFEMIRESLDGP